MTVPDPNVPTAPTPSSVGARTSPNWTYRCEVCGDPVEVEDYGEAIAETTRRNRNAPRWGVIIRCDAHRLPGKPPKAPTHPR